MKKFKYEWQLKEASYIGTAKFETEEALKAHIDKVGGKLICIKEVELIPEPIVIPVVPVVIPKVAPTAPTAVATVATLAVSLFLANWLANKLVGGKCGIYNTDPVKSRFLPW